MLSSKMSDRSETMKIISLSKKIGENLGHRSNAAEFREEILRLNEPVQLDFSGVKIVSYSFADEFFGRLANEFGKDVFRTRIIVKNLRPESQSVMRAAIENRTKNNVA